MNLLILEGVFNMRKIITFVYVFILIVFLKFVITFITNEMFISKYNKGIYEKNLVKSLFVLNFSIAEFTPKN